MELFVEQMLRMLDRTFELHTCLLWSTITLSLVTLEAATNQVVPGS
jgi:hypothetical protein